jgi:AcrR family transcriptional regulator
MDDRDKPRPRTQPPEARRAALMNAAQRLFLEQGVGPTTIEQITAAAEVAKGTFYLYYRSKEDLRGALGDRYAESHRDAVRGAVEAAEGWHERLIAWMRASVDFYLDAIALHDVLFYEASERTREGDVDNVVIDHLTALLEAGRSAGAWSIADARFTAVLLFSGLHGVVDDAYTKEKPVDRAQLVARLEQVFLRMVG